MKSAHSETAIKIKQRCKGRQIVREIMRYKYIERDRWRERERERERDVERKGGEE